MGEEEFDDVVFADSPEPCLAVTGADVVGVRVDDPGAGLPDEVVAAVVADDDLLAEVVVTVLGVVAFPFAAPHTDHG